MKKKVLSLVLALALVVVTAFSSVAATRQGSIDLADLRRLQETVAKARGCNAKVINYQKVGPGEWMVKLDVRTNNDVTTSDGKVIKAADQCCGDFRVKFSATAPAQGTNLGKCWYWFGLFDNTNNICGYAIAVREYQHMAGKYYGGYTQPDSYVIPEFN